MVDLDIIEIVESGDQLPESLAGDDLTDDSFYIPFFDGQKIVYKSEV